MFGEDRANLPRPQAALFGAQFARKRGLASFMAR